MKASEIQERREKISHLLKVNNKVRVSDLVQTFQVSDETIRKDFEFLEKQGILKKVYGGAELNKTDGVEPVSQRTTSYHSEKMAIVTKAFEFIPEEKCIISLDQGSTVAMLARLLNKHRNKTIITGSLMSILELVESENKLYCTGGIFSKEDMSFQGNIASDTLRDIRADICFLGSSGILDRKGMCSSSFADAELKRELVNKSNKNIVLLDHSKFYKSSFVEAVKWESIDYVITNKEAPKDLVEKLSQVVKVIIA
jgi:DeoR/GlpR family transcriptional regulator of sugar metabolism